MGSRDDPKVPERDQTDESLRVERERADEVIDDRGEVEDAADAVIGKARARADELIAKGRARTDRHAGAGLADARAAGIVDWERHQADEVLRAERAEADEIVRVERAQNARLVVERSETDKDLSAERSSSDDAVATRDALLGMVSHDLRNMLSTMVGFAALIAKIEADASAPHSEDVRAYAWRIQRSGSRMSRLVGDLVDVASIEANALSVTGELGDPRDVVTETVETFQTVAVESGLTLVVEVPSEPMRGVFDPARLLQVLANLVGNAIKFTPPGGRVVIGLAHVGDELRFEVRDTGVGIPAEQLEAVFDRFYQVTKTDRRSVGLGLYISKCIVQGHGGRIGVDSRPGEGSRFWFTLPCDV